MGDLLGVAAAAFSSGLGGTSIGATRFLASAIDPLAIGSFRFGIGVLLLLPIVLLRRQPLPPRGDWPAIVALGLMFFGLYPILFNAAFIYTTAAHGALTLATLPLFSIVIGAVLGREAPTKRKTAGVLVAMAGVGAALAAGPKTIAAAGAWRGDVLMVLAVICMALYGIWSKPYLARAGTMPFTVVAMGSGAVALIVLSLLRGGFAPVAGFDGYQWTAVIYLGAVGGAFSFFLWSYGLQHTTPTRVALTVAINPVTASLYGQWLLHEPLTPTFVIGIVLVGLGIWLGTSNGRRAKDDTPVIVEPALGASAIADG